MKGDGEGVRERRRRKRPTKRHDLARIGDESEWLEMMMMRTRRVTPGGAIPVAVQLMLPAPHNHHYHGPLEATLLRAAGPADLVDARGMAVVRE